VAAGRVRVTALPRKRCEPDLNLELKKSGKAIAAFLLSELNHTYLHFHAVLGPFWG
jgi:hypothetical protein